MIVSLLALLSASTGAATAAHNAPELIAVPHVGQPALVGELLQAHNGDRHRLGLAPLAWDPMLAEGARTHANALARLNLIQHSPKAGRRGIGENLWMGTRGYYRPATMVGTWSSERRWFRAGRFPDVSTTGNWADVGHYTQMIWRATKRVGCAISRSATSDILVCRYWPSGNVSGRTVP